MSLIEPWFCVIHPCAGVFKSACQFSHLSLATVLQWLGFSQVNDLGSGCIEGYTGLGKSAVLYYVYNSNQGFQKQIKDTNLTLKSLWFEWIYNMMNEHNRGRRRKEKYRVKHH